MGAFEIVIGGDAQPSSFAIVIGTSSSLVPGRGSAGAATLVFDAANNAKVTYRFATNILRARNGYERRIALIGCPQEIYTFTTELTAGELLALQSSLARDAALGSKFLLALTHESLLLSADAAGTTVTVATTLLSDWVYPGSRVIVLGHDGTKVAAVIQSSTPTTIELDVAPGATGVAGHRIMPAVECALESTQQAGVYAVNGAQLTLRARGTLFGNADGDWDPQGAVVTTYTDPENLKVYPVWDAGIALEDSSSRALVFGTEIVDRGAAVEVVAPWAFSQFVRQVSFTVADDADRQWVKKFVGTVRGQQRPFLLPTWTPDLEPVGDASTGTIVVYGPPTVDTADYVGAWFHSTTHHFLQLWLADGTVAYRKVYDQVDNGDGTQTLLLDSALAGDLQMVSFLELVRFDTDELSIEYEDDGLGHFEEQVRVLQFVEE